MTAKKKRNIRFSPACLRRQRLHVKIHQSRVNRIMGRKDVIPFLER